MDNIKVDNKDRIWGCKISSFGSG